jgi:DNA mismatch repair ATPase MutS
MKVFLMYPNRDFQVERVEQKFPHKKVPFIPNEKAALIQDLELDVLFNAMALGDEFLLDVVKQAVLSSLDAPEVIRYRQEILKDCLKHPDLVRQIYRIPIQSIENKQKHWMGIFSNYPSGILSSAREMLEMFVGLLKNLKKIADEHSGEFESAGFRRFFEMIQHELGDEYFAVVKEHLKEMKFDKGVLLSAELGKGNEGANYILRKPNAIKGTWIQRIFASKSQTFSFMLDPRDEGGARMLGDLRDRGLNLVANAVAQSADHIDSFLNALRTELAFYIGCLNLAEQLAQLGEPTAFPEAAPTGKRRHSFTGLYDVTLALTMKQKVVGNDVKADGKDLVFITGANQGGKSTFLRSIGLAQMMMQCGMFVPAKSFRADVCTGLFTHYRREEDTTMTSGKFDEELSRMSEIVGRLTPNSMVLFNESFAATNEREGSEIGRQIVRALLEKRVKVFFVTHQYELAHGFYDEKMANAIYLRAERREDGTRTFKLIEGEPLQTSYGKDLYDRIFG